MSKPQIIEHATLAVNFTPFAVRWVPASARLVAVGSHPRGSGTVRVLALEKGRLVDKAEHETKAGVKCATFNASAFEQRQVAVGDYAGGVSLYDLERLEKPAWSVPDAHSGMVNCVDGCGGLNVGGGAPELVTGSRDGTVRVWDPRQREPVAALEPAEGEKARDCWAVAFGNSFNDDERVVAAGYDNGDVKVLDLRMRSLLWEANVGNGVVGLEFDRRDIPLNKMAVTGLESAFRVYDMRTRHDEEGYAHVDQSAHKSTVWGARFLPQNRDVFMTAGGNGSVAAWRYEYPDKRSVKDKETGKERGVPGTVHQVQSKKLSDQPIVSLDWNADKKGLFAAAALDQTIKVGLVTGLP